MLKKLLSLFLFPWLVFAQAPTVTVPTRAGQNTPLTSLQADSIGTTLQHQVNASNRNWGYKELGSSGLIFAYYGGPAWNGTTYVSQVDGQVTLTASSTNYVQRTVAGVVSTNTSGWTTGQLPLYVVTTGSTSIITIVDQRTDYVSSGALVSSVFGRTGAVVAAANDYSFSLISGVATTGQIPSLPASQITSGQLALARGGTNADLSATGGASRFLQQSTVGGAITVVQPAFTDLSGAATTAQIATALTTPGPIGGTTASTISGTAITATTQFTGPGTGLTGTATSLTAGTATNATQLGGTAAASYALLAGPTFTGVPTAPTATQGNNSTQLATTAYSDNLGTALGDTQYWSASGTRARLAGSTSASKRFLTQTGNGSASAAPGWNAIVAGDMPVFVASGGGHAAGAVPDPGSTVGTTRYLREDATWVTPPLGEVALFKSTSGVSVSNSTTETSLFGSGVGSLTIPANSLSVGSVIRIKIRGVLSIPATSATLTVRVKVGGTTVVATAAEGISGGVSQYHDVEADLVVTAIGSSGSIIGSGRHHRSDAALGDFIAFAMTGSATTINTTTGLAVDCTVQWSSMQVSYIVTSITGTVEQL